MPEQTLTDILTSPYIIALLLFVVALAYSSVGLGGGSSYTALLAIAGYSSVTIPMVSLTLNLIVTSVGSYNFIRHRLTRPIYDLYREAKVLG